MIFPPAHWTRPSSSLPQSGIFVLIFYNVLFIAYIAPILRGSMLLVLNQSCSFSFQVRVKWMQVYTVFNYKPKTNKSQSKENIISHILLQQWNQSFSWNQLFQSHSIEAGFCGKIITKKKKTNCCFHWKKWDRKKLFWFKNWNKIAPLSDSCYQLLAIINLGKRGVCPVLYD